MASITEEMRNAGSFEAFMEGRNPDHRAFYQAIWDSMVGNASLTDTEDVGMPMMPSMNMGIGYDINILTEAGKNALETFMDTVPGARKFMEFYLPHIQSMMEAQPEAYGPGFDLAAGANEKKLMDMQMARLGQVPDLAKAYEGAFDAYLPMLEREYSQSVEETQGRLEALGLSGSSPGLEILSDMGAEHAVQVAGLRKDLDIQRAQAKTDMFNLQGTQLGAAWDMTSREAQRQYDTQRMEYADWLRQTGQQAELASLLGTPTYNTMFGGMANVFNTGQSGAASLGSSQMAAQSGLMSTQYNALANASMAQWEFNAMQPYLAMANQPVQIPSSGGLCVVATAAFGPEDFSVKVCRRYRDKYMSRADQLGYYVFAELAVPLMLKFPKAMRLGRQYVIKLVEVAMYRLGISSHKPGWKSSALAVASVGLWKALGKLAGSRWTRSNGETVDDSIARHNAKLKKENKL